MNYCRNAFGPLMSWGTLRKLEFHFLSNWMGYDRGDSFPFNLNQMDFHLVQNQKEKCHHDHIPFNLKGNRMWVFSVRGLSEFLTWFMMAIQKYGMHSQSHGSIFDPLKIWWNIIMRTTHCWICAGLSSVSSLASLLFLRLWHQPPWNERSSVWFINKRKLLVRLYSI